MAERYEAQVDDSGLTFSTGTTVVNEVTVPALFLRVDPANMAVVTTLAGTDLVLVGVGGVVKAITLANLLAAMGALKYVLQRVRFGGAITEVTGAGNLAIRQKLITKVPGMTNTLKGARIVDCDGLPGTSGSTTVQYGNRLWADREGVGAELATVTIPYNESYGDFSGCDIELDGDEGGAWISVVGGEHEGLAVEFLVEITAPA